MGDNLKTALNLPNVDLQQTNQKRQEFGEKFRNLLQDLNKKLGIVASQASGAVFQTLAGKRDKLIEAYQAAAGQIDSANASKAKRDVERVLSVAESIDSKASQAADKAAHYRDQWFEREADLDDALLKVAEMRHAGRRRAEAFFKVCSQARKFAQHREYEKALTALDAMLPRLEASYDEHLAEVASEQAALGAEALTVFVKDAVSGKPIGGAQVEIGDLAEGASEHGLATFMLSVGSHAYRVQNDGWFPIAGTVQVEVGDNPTAVVQLEPMREGFAVLVRERGIGDPIVGASVVVGDQTDVTDANGLATVETPLGHQPFKVDAKGFRTETGGVVVSRGEVDDLVVELERAPAKLSITVLDAAGAPVAGATVRVSGKRSGRYLGQTNPAGIAVLYVNSLVDEQHLVFASCEDVTWDPVELSPGTLKQSEAHDVTLDRARGPGIGMLPVNVTTDGEDAVVGATVRVAGKSAFTDATGRAELFVPVGRHELTISANGYYAVEWTVDVYEGENQGAMFVTSHNGVVSRD